jgi:hypothetical protein
MENLDGIDFVGNSKISSFCTNPPPTVRYRTYGLIIPHSAAVGAQPSGAEAIASEHLECADEDLDIAGGKACEAGAIPVGPLFAQAIEDALDLHARGIEILPLSPGLLWQLLAQAK